MSMTRRDYETVAETLRMLRPSLSRYLVDGDYLYRDLVKVFCQQFKIYYPNFNESRFITACLRDALDTTFSKSEQ